MAALARPRAMDSQARRRLLGVAGAAQSRRTQPRPPRTRPAAAAAVAAVVGVGGGGGGGGAAVGVVIELHGAGMASATLGELRLPLGELLAATGGRDLVGARCACAHAAAPFLRVKLSVARARGGGVPPRPLVALTRHRC